MLGWDNLEPLDPQQRRAVLDAFSDRLVLVVSDGPPKDVPGELSQTMVVGAESVLGIGDADWFATSLQAGQLYEVTLTPSGAADLLIEGLYDSAGSFIPWSLVSCSWNGLGSGDAIYKQVCRSTEKCQRAPQDRGIGERDQKL